MKWANVSQSLINLVAVCRSAGSVNMASFMQTFKSSIWVDITYEEETLHYAITRHDNIHILKEPDPHYPLSEFFQQKFATKVQEPLS